jgi:hypothetical protein
MWPRQETTKQAHQFLWRHCFSKIANPNQNSQTQKWATLRPPVSLARFFNSSLSVGRFCQKLPVEPFCPCWLSWNNLFLGGFLAQDAPCQSLELPWLKERCCLERILSLWTISGEFLAHRLSWHLFVQVFCRETISTHVLPAGKLVIVSK